MEITKAQLELEERKEGKDLYSYQKGAIDKIFTAFEESPEDYHLLYQLPTGGGKTVCALYIASQLKLPTIVLVFTTSSALIVDVNVLVSPVIAIV